MSARLNDWQRPVRIKDLAGVPIDEQKKAANIVLSYLDRFDTTFLIELVSKIMQVLKDRGLGEDLSMVRK